MCCTFSCKIPPWLFNPKLARDYPVFSHCVEVFAGQMLVVGGADPVFFQHELCAVLEKNNIMG
jgi:hypothetical protein